MVKRTRQKLILYRSVPDWPAYTASAHTGLLFISRPRQSGVIFTPRRVPDYGSIV